MESLIKQQFENRSKSLAEILLKSELGSHSDFQKSTFEKQNKRRGSYDLMSDTSSKKNDSQSESSLHDDFDHKPHRGSYDVHYDWRFKGGKKGKRNGLGSSQELLQSSKSNGVFGLSSKRIRSKSRDNLLEATSEKDHSTSRDSIDDRPRSGSFSGTIKFRTKENGMDGKYLHLFE